MEAMLVGNFMEKRGIFQVRAWSIKRGDFQRPISPCFAVKRGVKCKEKSMEWGLNWLRPTSMASIFTPARPTRVEDAWRTHENDC